MNQNKWKRRDKTKPQGQYQGNNSDTFNWWGISQKIHEDQLKGIIKFYTNINLCKLILTTNYFKIKMWVLGSILQRPCTELCALTIKEKWGHHSVARPGLYFSIFQSVLLLSFLDTAHSSRKSDLEHRVRFGSSLPTQGPIFLSSPLAQSLGIKTESLIPSFLPQIMRQSPSKGSHLQRL